MLFSTHESLWASPSCESVNYIWLRGPVWIHRSFSFMWARTFDNRAEGVFFFSLCWFSNVCLLLLLDVRVEQRGDDAEGLRPAPDFHTWRDLNKGRDFETGLTPNNTGPPPNNSPTVLITMHSVYLYVCDMFHGFNQTVMRSTSEGFLKTIWCSFVLFSDFRISDATISQSQLCMKHQELPSCTDHERKVKGYENYSLKNSTSYSEKLFFTIIKI